MYNTYMMSGKKFQILQMRVLGVLVYSEVPHRGKKKKKRKQIYFNWLQTLYTIKNQRCQQLELLEVGLEIKEKQGICSAQYNIIYLTSD